jgi:hypothetical protein
VANESSRRDPSAKPVIRVTRARLLRVGLPMLGTAVLAACAQQPAAPATPQVVEKVVTQVVEKPVEKQVVVTQVVEKQVTQVVEKQVTQVVEKPAGVKETLLMNHFQPFYMTPLTPLIAAKTGIAIDVQLIPGDYWGGLTAQLASGGGPDILLLDVNNWAGFFKMDVIDDFNPIAKAAKVDTSKFYVDPMKENGFNGKLMGLSQVITDSIGVWFNADLADKYGFAKDLPTWDSGKFDTWTMKDLTDFMRRIVQKKSSGETDIYAWETGVEWGWWEVHKHLTLSNGGQWFPDLGDYQPTKLTINSPESVEALQQIVDLMKEGVAVPWSVYKTGSSKGGDWVYLAKKSLSWNFDFYSRANLDPYKGLRQYYIALPGYKKKMRGYQFRLLAVNKNGKKKDATAQAILTSCTDPDVCLAQAEMPYYLPAYDPAAVIPKIKDPEVKLLAEMNVARIEGLTSKPELAKGVEIFPAETGIKSGWTGDAMNALHDAMDGKAGLKEGLDAVVNKWNAEFAKGY